MEKGLHHFKIAQLLPKPLKKLHYLYMLFIAFHLGLLINFLSNLYSSQQPEA